MAVGETGEDPQVTQDQHVTRTETLQNTELGETLYVSLPTVKTHLSKVLTTLDARDRTQLVVFTYEAGPAPAP